MLIFNQGKYKSLHAQQTGELNALRHIVQSDHDFYPTYHLAPPTGLLNDPNGLIFDGEKFHFFYQWFPYDAIHGMKHWKHFISTDLQNFAEADPLVPDELFESHGCYSGGAILWQGQIVAFYTGNTRRASDNQRVPHQNIAIFSREGRLLAKRCLLEQAPEGYTEHVRDPKPFITPEGKIRFVLGAQRQDLSGTALVYEMDDLNSSPRLLGELTLKGFDNQNVFMWECPDLFQLGDNAVFIWSPQGKVRETLRYQNNYHATYALGTLNDKDFCITHFEELDYGFDFYAPQTVQNGQGMLLGWVGLPDLTYPTDKFKWHSMLSLPRQLTVKQGKIHQTPAEQVYAMLDEPRTLTLNGTQTLDDLEVSYLQIFVENAPLALRFFHNAKGQSLSLTYEKGVLSLDRSNTEQTELMQQFGTVRHCEVAQLDHLAIFFDRSVVEIFVNGGEKVLTSRFFIAQRENQITTSRQVEAKIAKVKPINYV